MTAPGAIALDDKAYENFPLDPGFCFPTLEVSISAGEQQRLHGYCDIAPAVFGPSADPALVSRLPIVVVAHTILAQRPGWGPVHLVQRIVQHRRIALGETLQLRGEVGEISVHPRGERMSSSWRYHAADGECVFEVLPQVLMIDPAGRANAGQRAAAESNQIWQQVGRKQCTPASTLGYCEGTRNPVHLDPEVAQRFGFRAPIIAGTQTMSFLLEALYRARRPDALDLSMRFLRPVFWDDALTLEANGTGEDLTEVRARNAAGKEVATLNLDRCAPLANA